MKVFINPGHHPGIDSGAVNPTYGTKECDVVKEAGEMLADYLTNAGCEVRIMQDDNLVMVCDESNEWGADVFVSLHCNASQSKLAVGTESYYKSFNGQRLANYIQSQIIRSVQTTDRGVKPPPPGGLYVLGATDAVAVLVEMAFIDNDADLQLLNNDLDKIVRAIARGVTDYQGGY